MLHTFRRHFVEIIVLFFILLFLMWLIGYLLNPFLFKTRFQIESVWVGIQALSGAGFLGIVKYIVDSKYNSKTGAHPYSEEKEEEKLPPG